MIKILAVLVGLVALVVALVAGFNVEAISLDALAKPLSRDGGSFGVVQRAPNKKEPCESKDHGGPGCNKHEFCPKGHFFLSYQIPLLVFAWGLALGCAFLSYGIADRGFNLAEGGRKFLGTSVFFFAVFFGPTSVGGALYGGYWLTFENGWLRILG